MKMIIGGAFQGKTGYAKELYPDITFCEGERCSLEELLQAKGVLHFECFLQRFLESNQSEQINLAEELMKKNPDLIIVTTEIGYGLVPVDKFERTYREYTGRVCTKLAKFSDRVDRVVCGVGVQIK